jgi:hypothetical protein
MRFERLFLRLKETENADFRDLILSEILPVGMESVFLESTLFDIIMTF